MISEQPGRKQEQGPYPHRYVLPHQYYFPLLDIKDRVHSSEEIVPFERSVLSRPLPGNRKMIVYVHVPFCSNRCAFCPFNTHVEAGQVDQDEYIDAVERELKYYSRFPAVIQAEKGCLYLGGGTPTMLSERSMDRLINLIRRILSIPAGVPLTCEGDARTLTAGRLKRLRSLGISRVSFGIQGFEEKFRHDLQLRASIDDIHRCAEAIHATGMDFFVDLLYGMPGQTVSGVLEDLKRTIELHPQGIDFVQFYPISTPMMKEIEAGKIQLPAQEESISMLDEGTKKLESAGYRQFSAYSFVSKDSTSLIDTAYFGSGDLRNKPMNCLGIGPSSIGWMDGYTYRNQWSPNYLDNEDTAPPFMHLRRITKSDADVRDLVLFPKRLEIGKECIPRSALAKRRKTIEVLKSNGLICEDSSSLRLTELGRLYIDNIQYDLLPSEEKKRMKGRIWVLPRSRGPHQKCPR